MKAFSKYSIVRNSLIINKIKIKDLAGNLGKLKSKNYDYKLRSNFNNFNNFNFPDEKMISFAAARVAKDSLRGPCARICRTRVARRNPASLTNGREIDVSIADTRNASRWE